MLKDHDEIISKIYEKVDYEIDKDVKEMLGSSRVRKEMKKKYGNDAFLDSNNLKFPVINPKTGVIDCKLIYAAVIRSSIFTNKGGTKLQPKEYYENIKTAAVKLYKDNKCGDKIKAKLQQEEIDVLHISDIFDIVESEHEKLEDRTNYIEG